MRTVVSSSIFAASPAASACPVHAARCRARCARTRGVPAQSCGSPRLRRRGAPRRRAHPGESAPTLRRRPERRSAAACLACRRSRCASAGSAARCRVTFGSIQICRKCVGSSGEGLNSLCRTPRPALIAWTSPGAITEPVPMLSLCSSFAGEHVGDDLHVAVTVGAEAHPRLHAVLVDHAQRAEAHVVRVVIVGEREAVKRVEPAVLLRDRARLRVGFPSRLVYALRDVHGERPAHAVAHQPADVARDGAAKDRIASRDRRRRPR